MIKSFIRTATPLFLLTSIFLPTSSANDALAQGKASYAVCASCHGQQGEGQKLTNSPRISHLSSWYLTSSIKKFKTNERGYHASDTNGAQMKAMAALLPNSKAINNVVAYIKTLSSKKALDKIEGDPVKGKALYMICSSCHSPDGTGNEAMSAPQISGQHGWYIQNQLKAFKTGLRGTQKGDATGAQMVPMASTLIDDKAIADVVAYIQTLK
ncbi:MAG: c-type cytochrome [Candidatus Cloacimonetes bacterium]|nr:c-type cytochrome [Candidatus Cloacimonadota bacterium]